MTHVVGGTVAVLPSAVQDLARFFLSLAGSSSQGALLGAAGTTVPASRVGVWLCPSAPGGGAVASLRRRLLLWQLDLLPHPLLCQVRPADSSVRKSSPVRADAAVARPVVGLAERVRNDLGNTTLPLFALLATGRLPIGLLLLLLKKIEPCRLLLPLDLCLEVHLSISVPLRWVTARLVLAFRACGVGLLLPRIGLLQVLAVICPPPLGEVDDDRSSALDSLDIDTLTGMTLSGLSWPSSRTFMTWKNRQASPRLVSRLLLHRSMG